MSLVTAGEFAEYLDDTSVATSAAVEALLSAVEARFLTDCGRADRPFQPAETGRVEVSDATGTRTLYLDYPVAALTSVVLGFDPLDPDETLDLTDPAVLVYGVGSRRLVRRNGVFGACGLPRYVHVTYSTQEELPDDVILAIKEMTAALYGSRGSEAIRVERLGNYSVEMGSLAEGIPSWRAAVDNHRAVLV